MLWLVTLSTGAVAAVWQPLLSSCRPSQARAGPVARGGGRRGPHMYTEVACPLIGREIDVESQKALCKVKHSCSEVIRALTLRFEEHSGIDRVFCA